jgi:hypothetical protein
MSRRDDGRDEPRRDEEKGLPTSVMVLGLLVLGLFAIAAIGGVYWLLSDRQSAREVELLRAEALQARAVAADAEARAQAVPAAKAMGEAMKPDPISRDDFKAKVLGKTPEQVIEAVGKPDRTADEPDPTWFYDRRTVDPVSRAVDGKARLTFKSGVVALVNFS